MGASEGRGEANPDGDTTKHAARWARLSVNIGDEPAAALRDIMSRQGISATEAVRRAISVLKFVDDEQRAGNELVVIEARGWRGWLLKKLA